jgi:hypothetical protein
MSASKRGQVLGSPVDIDGALRLQQEMADGQAVVDALHSLIEHLAFARP